MSAAPSQPTARRSRGGSARLRPEQRADNCTTLKLNEHKLLGCDSVYEEEHRATLHGPGTALPSPNGGRRGSNCPQRGTGGCQRDTGTAAVKGPCDTALANAWTDGAEERRVRRHLPPGLLQTGQPWQDGVANPPAPGTATWLSPRLPTASGSSRQSRRRRYPLLPSRGLLRDPAAARPFGEEHKGELLTRGSGAGGGTGLTLCPRKPLAQTAQTRRRDEQWAEEGAGAGTRPSPWQSEPPPQSGIRPRKGSVILSFVTGAKGDRLHH